MVRLLTEKKAEWARKQKEKERKMEERKAKDNETEQTDKGKAKQSGKGAQKPKKNTFTDPEEGFVCLDVGQPAKKAEAANKAKLSARGGPIEEPTNKRKRGDDDEEEEDYDPNRGESSWGREKSDRQARMAKEREEARKAEAERLKKQRQQDEKEAKPKPSKTGEGHAAGGLRVGCARVGVCVWVRVCFVCCAVCCAVFCAWLHAHARTPAHRHARTTGTNAKLARMERMMADMAAQMQANINAVQAGAAVRQVRWGVHGAWHGISCLQT